MSEVAGTPGSEWGAKPVGHARYAYLAESIAAWTNVKGQSAVSKECGVVTGAASLRKIFRLVFPETARPGWVACNNVITTDRQIRPLQLTDMPEVKAAIDACGLFPPELPDGMTERYFSGQAQTDSWLTYVDGRPVAVAYCAPEPMTQGTWNLLLIAVHPDSQRRGYGAAIMSHVERTVAANGSSAITWRVWRFRLARLLES